MRTLAAALLVANLAFFAWTLGWLDAVIGVSPVGDREPQRLQRQIDPQRLRIVHGTSAPATPDSASPGDAVSR